MIKTLGFSIVTAGIIGAGALGLAGTAAAATTSTAPTAKPGWHNDHGPARIVNLQNG